MEYPSKQTKQDGVEDVENIFDKLQENKDLQQVLSNIANSNLEKDLESLKYEKAEYTKTGPLYKKRAEELRKIPNFWSTVFTKAFEGFFTSECEEPLISHVTDMFVEDTETEFNIQLTFKKNDIIGNDKVTITCQSPVTIEDFSKELEIKTTPELKILMNEEENVDLFLQFLKTPTTQHCLMIVGNVWKNPLSVYLMEEGEDLVVELDDDDVDE